LTTLVLVAIFSGVLILATFLGAEYLGRIVAREDTFFANKQFDRVVAARNARSR
jgi:hypothetical protein